MGATYNLPVRPLGLMGGTEDCPVRPLGLMGGTEDYKLLPLAFLDGLRGFLGNKKPPPMVRRGLFGD